MKETTEPFFAGEAGEAARDPDKTLVQPRFDAVEARTAQPVVPLGDARAHARRRGGRGLPIVLILVSAVVGGLVSVLAYRTYQQGRARAATEQSQAQQPQPTPEEAAEQTPTPELTAEAAPEAAPPAEQREAPAEEATAEAKTPIIQVEAESRDERATAAPERRPEAAPAESAPRRAGGGVRLEHPREPERPRRTDAPTRPLGERVSRRERGDDSDLENEATDYEAPAERRARRRANRRAGGGGRRNVDRVRAIFEGAPPPTN